MMHCIFCCWGLTSQRRVSNSFLCGIFGNRLFFLFFVFPSVSFIATDVPLGLCCFYCTELVRIHYLPLTTIKSSRFNKITFMHNIWSEF